MASDPFAPASEKLICPDAAVAAEPAAASPRVNQEADYVISDSLHETMYPDGGPRAWLVVLGAFCATCATFGFTNSWVVWQSLYEKERLQNSSPSAIAWIGSTQYALIFVPGLFTGRLFDTGYFRLPLAFWSCVLVTSCFAIGECQKYWHYLLVQGIVVGLACRCLYGPVIAVISHWFKERRAFAFSITATGSSIGGTVYPILARNLERKLGKVRTFARLLLSNFYIRFKWSVRVLGFVLCGLLVIANLTLRRRIPPSPTSRGLVDLQAFRHKPYSIFVGSCVFCFLGIYAVLTFLDTAAIKHGVDLAFSFYLIAIANASSGMGRLTAGMFGDKIGAVNTMIPFSIVAAVTTFAWPFATMLRSIITVAAFYGFASGTFVPLLVIPVARMGPIGDVGTRTGMQTTIMALGALSGPPISGAISSAAGSYIPLGVFAGSMVLISAALMILTKRVVTGSWLRSRF